MPATAGKLRADRFVEQIPCNGWQILSASRGSKGERLYAWAFTSISDSEPTHHRWLLLRRNLHTGELAYFLCHATSAAPLATLVRVAGTRWRVEENFQAGKGCAGLDEHQVRTWTSWHRWTTLAMLAHAFLAVTAARARQPTTTHTASTTPSDTEHQTAMIPLTCNEIRHLRTALTRPIHDQLHIARWSRFRRRHQHRARHCNLTCAKLVRTVVAVDRSQDLAQVVG